MTVTVEQVTEQITIPTEEQIRRRAYEIYLERGSQDGQNLSDWIQAENELMAMIQKPMAAQQPARVKGKSAAGITV